MKNVTKLPDHDMKPKLTDLTMTDAKETIRGTMTIGGAGDQDDLENPVTNM